MTAHYPTALILNSAHSKYPCGNDPWVQATMRAVDALAAGDVTLLASTEPIMWDFAAWYGGTAGMNMKLLLPKSEKNNGGEHDAAPLKSLGIPQNCLDILFFDTTANLSGKDIWRERDRVAIHSADVICPISIRPGGRLETLLASGGYTADFWQEFRVPWEETDTTHRLPAYDFAGKRPRPFPSGEWLIHWTRASQGQWPGEPMHRFFSDMLAAPDRYVRSASDTLARILTEQRLRGSSWMQHGDTPVVSLTSLDPSGAFPLMRWRKRFVRYNFEPYGIAINRDIAVAHGAREVTYVDSPGAASGDPVFHHASGEKTDWRDEQEWRIPGDLDLSALPGGSYFAIVPEERDAERLRERAGDGVGVHVLFG